MELSGEYTTKLQAPTQAVGSAPDGGTGDAPPSDRQAILNEAWIYAVHGGHADTADYLLDHGAQIDAIEPTAWMPMRVSALHFAALRGDVTSVVRPQALHDHLCCRRGRLRRYVSASTLLVL